MAIDHTISAAISLLKREFISHHKNTRSMLAEVVPVSRSEFLPIDDDILESLHRFVESNPIYRSSHDTVISGIECRVYEGDFNNYWLSSKKHDTSYQPFYPTWVLSAYELAAEARTLGFEQLIDIGSGDGRILYCASLLDMESYGLELDSNLIQVQHNVSSSTGIKYEAVHADATCFNYATLNLTKPIFFISGLPEMGEMLANSVIEQVLSIDKLSHNSGFNFMGSHINKSFARDRTSWGWGSIISRFGLKLIGTITLPTLWTMDQIVDTAYVYTQTI
jgi:hypothetical protein